MLVNLLPACSLRTRRQVVVCPRCNTVMDRSLTTGNVIDDAMRCPNPRPLSPEWHQSCGCAAQPRRHPAHKVPGPVRTI